MKIENKLSRKDIVGGYVESVILGKMIFIQVDKNNLYEIAKGHKLDVDDNMDVKTCYDMLIASGLDSIQLAKELSLGIPEQYYEQHFNIDYMDVKKLEDHGHLTVVSHYKDKIGTEYTMYDVEQFVKYKRNDVYVILDELKK